MKAFVFPGQASQFEGMGHDMYTSDHLAKSLFDRADEILEYQITDIMFTGTREQLKETRITQPAVFLHSVIKAKIAGNAFQPDCVAGHSLGEFSALVAAGALSFEDGLKLVQIRAEAMQEACDLAPSTMAAVLGLEDDIVKAICSAVEDTVIAANFNCPGQVVISGTVTGVEQAVEKLKEAGARNTIILEVGGAFHSPLMEPARQKLEEAINSSEFVSPICPIYQNVDALAHTDIEKIKSNLILQLTAPVLWTQTMKNMISDGVDRFIEVGGTGKVLRGFVARVDRSLATETL
jgi:[acyl-carrier-protein] S-malonyltransferase